MLLPTIKIPQFKSHRSAHLPWTLSKKQQKEWALQSAIILHNGYQQEKSNTLIRKDGWRGVNQAEYWWHGLYLDVSFAVLKNCYKKISQSRKYKLVLINVSLFTSLTPFLRVEIQCVFRMVLSQIAEGMWETPTLEVSIKYPLSNSNVCGCQKVLKQWKATINQQVWWRFQ